DALGDQVALDLGGPAHDRLRAGVEVGAAALLVEHRPRPEHLHRQLLEALVGLAAEHLLDRALHPRLPRAHEARQAPVADQAQQLHLDVRLREPLAVSRVGERPPGGGMRARVAEQALEAPPDRALAGDGPHLLAVHDEAVAPALAARAERAQVGAGAGLGEALAPEVLAREEPAEEARALRVRAVAEDGRPDQVDVGAGGGPGRARAIERLLEEPALDDRRAPAAVLARPGDRRPPAVVQLPLPVARDREPGRIVGARPAVG